MSDLPDHCVVLFKPSGKVVEARRGANLLDVVTEAEIDLVAPCGGYGRCGRCKVLVEQGRVTRRANHNLGVAEMEQGFALACQATIESDLVVFVQPREIVRKPPAEISAAEIALPAHCAGQDGLSIQKLVLAIEPPTMDDNTNDLDRLRRELARQHRIENVQVALPVLKTLSRAMRDAEWRVTVVLDLPNEAIDGARHPEVIAVLPGDRTGTSLGAAVDIGTTTVVLYLVDLLTGKVLEVASAYNGQISCGDDVISRIVFSQRNGDGLNHLQGLVVKTINGLLAEVAKRRGIALAEVNQLVAAGNTTMTHLFLGVNPKWVRESPYIPAFNHPPTVRAADLGIEINPAAPVHCLPGVGSYVGGDITAGVLSAGVYQTSKLTLFIDVGTNGEIVLGNSDWLITCACSAGPCFEGAGVKNGMRAARGAIEEVYIHTDSFEPTYQVIDGGRPRGICGSGMISLLGELFITGLIDKAGNFNRGLGTPRLRLGENGPEYVVATADESDTGHDIAITEADISNIIRAKGAIYAGFSVLVNSVGLSMADIEQIIIAGAFGRHINVEKAIQIGLLPDMPWDRFHYVGNSSALGAYACLVASGCLGLAYEIGQKMTYLELSADNRFMDEYTGGLFLPYTNLDAFPTVKALLEQMKEDKVGKLGARW